jgi:hypothetical protein
MLPLLVILRKFHYLLGNDLPFLKHVLILRQEVETIISEIRIHSIN